MDYTKRYLEDEIRKQALKKEEKKNVILLKGARQVGKTTTLKQIFTNQEAVFINLKKEPAIVRAIKQTESFQEFNLVLERYANFVPGQGKILIIDEAQLASTIGTYVESMKEEWDSQGVILTGSTLSDLFEQTSKPVGRVTEFTLRPFNFYEFLSALNENSILEHIKNWKIDKPHSKFIHQEILKLLCIYLSVGGLPAVVYQYKYGLKNLETDLWKRELETIIAYYQQDVESVKKTQLITLYEQTFRRLAITTGSQTLDSTVVKTSSPGYRYVKDIFALLEAWKLVIRVDAILSRQSKVGSVAPKRYLFDHGVRNFYTPWSMKFLELEDLNLDISGGIIEHFVLTELLSLNLSGPINYWLKTHQSGEVDFIFSKTDKFWGMEVKSSTKIDKKHLVSLKSFQELNKKAQIALVNLSQGKLLKEAGQDIAVVPAYQVFNYFNKG